MSILINDGSSEEDKVIKCDIGEFVVSVERVKKHMEPLYKFVCYIQSIWKYEFIIFTFVALFTYPTYFYILFLYTIHKKYRPVKFGKLIRVRFMIMKPKPVAHHRFLKSTVDALKQPQNEFQIDVFFGNWQESGLVSIW